MKNVLIILGCAFLVVNSSLGLVFSGFQGHNIIFSNVSIVLSTLLMYTSQRLLISDGFKIGVLFFLVISGLIRYVCALFSINQFSENIALFLFLFIFIAECVTIYVVYSVKDK